LLPFLGIPTCICFLDLLKSRHSKSSLPENACKFLFIYDAFAYVALISMVVEVRPTIYCDIRIDINGPRHNYKYKKYFIEIDGGDVRLFVLYCWLIW
ncbi:hypothetical protein T11_9834, partial [Trichinella zimbabwensis]